MKKRKVCIITNYSETCNYGAILQAYALNRVINNKGFDCKTLNFLPKNVKNRNNRKIDILINEGYKTFLKLLGKKIRKLIIRNKLTIRKKAFDDFRLQIPHTEEINVVNGNRVLDCYDIFIAGSDQIWKPTKDNDLIKYYWFDGFPENRVKASYAASIGLKEYPNKLIDSIKEKLKKIDKISVREKQSEIYLKKITNREDIKTVIDPVFLLEKEDWDVILNTKVIQDKYVIVYFIHQDKDILKKIKKFAKDNNLKIYFYPYMSYEFRFFDYFYGDIQDFNSSPNEFLYTLKNSEYVFTDSFHATAFSLIFHKKFITTSASKEAVIRLENLLNMFDVSNHLIYKSKDTNIEKVINNNIDWNKVDLIISKERKNGLKFISDILNYEL